MPRSLAPEEFVHEIRAAKTSPPARKDMTERAHSIVETLCSRRTSPTESILNSLFTEAVEIDEESDKIAEILLEFQRQYLRIQRKGAYLVVLSDPELEFRRWPSHSPKVTQGIRPWSLVNGHPYFTYDDSEKMELKFGSFSIDWRPKAIEDVRLQIETVAVTNEAELSCHVVDYKTAIGIALGGAA